MVLENYSAYIHNHRRPHTIATLNIIRAELLENTFFDPDHLPEEISVRPRVRTVKHGDFIVLLARLLRALSRRGASPVTDEDVEERKEVRSLCFAQPFFDGKRIMPVMPFTEEVDDEGFYEP